MWPTLVDSHHRLTDDVPPVVGNRPQGLEPHDRSGKILSNSQRILNAPFCCGCCGPSRCLACGFLNRFHEFLGCIVTLKGTKRRPAQLVGDRSIALCPEITGEKLSITCADLIGTVDPLVRSGGSDVADGVNHRLTSSDTGDNTQCPDQVVDTVFSSALAQQITENLRDITPAFERSIHNVDHIGVDCHAVGGSTRTVL